VLVVSPKRRPLKSEVCLLRALPVPELDESDAIRPLVALLTVVAALDGVQLDVFEFAAVFL
jgi:hypothetical protein